MKERIIALLGNNIAPAVVATAVGCSESYISQLLSDETISAEVSNLRFQHLQAASNRDGKADSIEDQLLDKLEVALPMMMRPADILRAYSVVNQAKRRGVAAPESAQINNQIVNLQLPKHAVVQFQLSGSKELIEVDGRELTTMTSANLLLEAKARDTNTLPGEVISVATN